MKKILCFILSALLLLNTTVVYADDIHGGSSGDLDVTPTPVIPQPAIPLQSVDELLFRLVFPDVAGAADSLQTWWDQWFADRWKNDEDKQKDYSVSDGGSTVHLHKQFVDDLNQAVQDKIHALDGYYLFEPPNLNKRDVIPDARQKYFDRYWHDTNGDKEKRAFIKSTAFETSMATLVDNNACAVFQGLYYQTGNDGPVGVYSSSDVYYIRKSCSGFDSANYMVIDPSSSNISIYNKENGINKSSDFYIWQIDFPSDSNNQLDVFNSNIRGSLGYFKGSMAYCYGSPFRVFYSKEDLLNFWNKGRTYAPQLPSTTISIPIKYINNSVSLPDITYNINTTNKTEVEIQNEYNTTLNNYLNDLNKFSDGGSGNNPTPTPSGGGSGDFGDGSTPTPTPPLGDGGSDQDGDGSDGWLKKIYDQLVKLSDSVSQHFEKEETFEDKLSKYLESHDKKLDGIVDAIDKLNQGKEEGKEKGCKYDYTELSDFMTKLWNDSDQKFDQMVELLKENNEYQEKMLSTLNSIKNILLAQTVMDAFKNRSSETANKAKEKFPTSVPWDIALIVNAMDAEPKAPVFELPIKIERLNIDEKITVDISSGEWEKLAKACRYMLSLLFVLFMVNLTRKLFFSKGDD